MDENTQGPKLVTKGLDSIIQSLYFTTRNVPFRKLAFTTIILTETTTKKGKSWVGKRRKNTVLGYTSGAFVPRPVYVLQ